MSNKSAKTRRYSVDEVKAYYLGVGFSAGMYRGSGYKRLLANLPERLHQSFKNGANDELALPTSRFLSVGKKNRNAGGKTYAKK